MPAAKIAIAHVSNKRTHKMRNRTYLSLLVENFISIENIDAMKKSLDKYYTKIYVNLCQVTHI